MKFATVSKSLALGFALTLGSNALAATKNNVQISHPVTVNGTTLKPGDYKVEWNGNGSNVELSIRQGKRVLATASAHVVESKDPSPYNAALTQPTGGGTSSLVGLRFEGKTIGLDLDGSFTNMQAGSGK